MHSDRAILSRWFVLPISWIVISTAWAQTPVTHFQRYTIADGLTDYTILSLLQDSTGFLWVGTLAGLNRFDGHVFKTYRSNQDDSTALFDDYIRSLYQDKKGILWVGTQQGGWHRYDPVTDTFKRFDLEAILGTPAATVEQSPNFVYTVQEADSHQYWLATGAGLVLFDPRGPSARMVGYGEPTSTSVRALHIDSEGYLWIGNDRGRVIRRIPVNDEGARSAQSVVMLDAGAPIRAFAPDAGGNIWIGTLGEGLFKYHRGDGRIDAFKSGDDHGVELASNRITTLFHDSQGGLWLGFEEGGLSLISPFARARHFVSGDDPLSLSDDTVLSLLRDREGNLWVGTWSGLNRLSPYFEAITRYSNTPLAGASPVSEVVAMMEDERQNVWIGTREGYVTVFERSTGRFVVSKVVGKSGHNCTAGIFDISQDRSGMVWFATFGDGICGLDLARNDRVLHYKASGALNALLDNQTLSLLPLSEGRLLIGTREKGLSLFDGGLGMFTSYKPSPHADSLPTGYIWPMVADTAGVVWLGAYDQGVVRFDVAEGRFTTYALDGGAVQANRIYDLALDAGGGLWVATDEGLRLFDRGDGSTQALTTTDGLAQDQVRGILEDDWGDLWFTTNDGLSRFTPATGKFKNFNLYDGLQAESFYARSVLKTRDGRVWFGGPEGFNIIDPRRIRTSEEPPRLVLSEIRVHGEPYRPTDGIPLERLERLDLESYENRFSLSFAVLDYTNVEQNRYRYRLREKSRRNSYLGLASPSPPPDSNWVELGAEHVINFPILAYGSYDLEVAGANSDGVWAERTLPITIDTPLWATEWFRALVILLVMGIVFGGVMLRERYRQGLDRFRLKLASGLHDDVGANLATIAMKVGILLRRAALTGEERTQLSQLGDIARETGFSVRDTEWIIKSQHDTLDQLVAQLRRLAETMLSGSVAHTFEVSPATVPVLAIDMDLRRNVFLLFKEALNNANKSARASHIAIAVRIEQDTLTIHIKDDGVGFDQAALVRSNGLRHMEMRAAEIAGHLDIASAPGEGTVVDLRVPLRLSWWGAWQRSRNRSGGAP